MDSASVWAEIDLNAIAHNIRELRRMINPETRLMVAVKANAYGHGAVETSRHVLAHGATDLGVARIEEGIQIRKAGIDAPILVFGHTDPALARQLLAFDLTQTVYSHEAAQQFSRIAISSGDRLKAHIKVDTGMGRLGLMPDDQHVCLPGMEIKETALETVKKIAALPGLDVEGIYTHFASADYPDKTDAETQFRLFMDFLDQIQNIGINIPVRHAANSAAIIDMPDTQLDMVRAGISVYGLYPSREVGRNKISLQPAMTLKTRIIQLKKVSSGFHVSYGSTYTTEHPTTIAVVPIGYADGLNRQLSSKGHMLVRQHKVPIIGRICMDFTMLDVGDIPEVAENDEVVILGNQGNDSIPAEEIADLLETINYEIVSTVSSRVPRIYNL